MVKPVTSLATEMCKMDFKAGYISPPTHPTLTRCTLECALVMCNAICGIWRVPKRSKHCQLRVPGENPRFGGGV